MSIPVTPNDPRVWIFANDTWNGVYRYVRQADGGMISIQLGNEDEALGDEINPGICTLTFDNNDGRFTPDNPMSPFYPDIEINTPICVGLDEIRDYYTRIASNTWGITSTGETYQTKSLGGAINATDYSTDGSVGIHSVPAAPAYRMSYLGSSSNAPTAYNVVQKVRYTPTFTNVTGANIEPANLVCRLANDTQYYLLRAEVTTAEEITLKIMKDGSTTLAGPVTVPGITHTIGQPIWFAFGAFDDGLYATAWQGDEIEDEPTDWLISATGDSSYGYGYYGIRSGVASGNTNASPVLFNYDYYVVYTSEFNGEVPEWPQEVSDDGEDQVVPITAAGILRRYAETKTSLKSSMRRFYEVEEVQNGDSADYYWPLDEGELSNEGVPAIGEPSVTFRVDFSIPVDSASEKHFSQGKLGVWLPNGIVVLPEDTGANIIAFPPSPTADINFSFWTVQWVRSGGAGTVESFTIGGHFQSGVYISGINGDIFSIVCDSFNQEITVNPGFLEAPVVIDSSLLDVDIFDGAAHLFTFRANVTGGTNLHWELQIDAVLIDSDTLIAHPFLQRIGAVYMTSSVGALGEVPEKPTTLAHVAIYVTNDVSDTEIAFNRLRGSIGDSAKSRVARLCNEESISHFISGSGGASMGPQFEDTLFGHLEEVVRTDGGMVRELVSARALHFIPLEELREIDVSLVLDVGDETIDTGGFKPVRDSQRLRNRVTAKKRSGSQYTYEKTTGRLGTADPKDGGSGVYDSGDAQVNPETDSQLISIAQREVAEGTVDKPRYPEITVNLMSDTMQNDLSLRRQVLDTYISTRMQLTNMTRWHIYEDADLLVIGHKRLLNPFIHKVTWNTIPFNSLDIFHVETDGSILGTDSSTIVYAIDSDDTTADVVTEGNALWTTNAASFPITIRINGEDISLTDVDTNVPTFRSVGTPSHGDNATTTPGLPAGHAVGDTLILVSAIRNTAATANTPAGWASITASNPSFTNFNIAIKNRDPAGESIPNCTYSGGAAGDTTSSFIIAFSNAQWLFTGGVSATGIVNSSAQNIEYTSYEIPRGNAVVFEFAWKQDDCTSINPGDLTEIIEASTTTGNDQLIYAAYRLMANQGVAPAGTLVVTGGAAAISKTVTMFIGNPQRFTMTRSLNGVVKSHAADSDVRIAYPKVLG